MELPPERLVLQQQPAIADQAVDLGQQVLEEDRLHQVVLSPALERGDGVLDRRVGRDHDEQRLRADLQRAVRARSGRRRREAGRRRGRRPARTTRPAPGAAGMSAAVATSKRSPWRNSLSVAAITSSSSTIRTRPRGAGGSLASGVAVPLLQRRPTSSVTSLSDAGRAASHPARAIGLAPSGPIRPADMAADRAGAGSQGSRTMNVEPWPGSERIAERAREVLEDLPADEQPQPGAVRLGGEERLEEPAAVGQRDPPAVVLDASARASRPRRGPATWIRPWSSVASIAFRTRFRTTCVR